MSLSGRTTGIGSEAARGTELTGDRCLERVWKILLIAAAPILVGLTAQAQVPDVQPGFPNVARTPGELLSGLNQPNQGRTAIIAYHNGILYTIPEVPSSQPGSDFQVRAWSLADPSAPSVISEIGTTRMPIEAHGYLKSGNYLSLGDNWPPESPWSFEYQSPGPDVGAGASPGPGTNLRTANPDLLCAGVRGCLYQPFFVAPSFWSYSAVGGNAVIERDGTELANWDHLGLTGVIGSPFLIGDLLIFASDQSRTGVATYDVSDLSAPVLLDVLTAGGPGGYFPELWGGDGRLYVVFPYRTGGNGVRIVDVTDPTNLSLIADTSLPGAEAMYLQFQDEFGFVGSHKVDMRTFQSVVEFDTAGNSIDTSQFALPIGNLLVTGGSGPNQGMAIWSHQAEPDTRGPSVGFHIPQAGRTNYPVSSPITLLIHETLETPTIVNGLSFIVRPLGGEPIEGALTFSFDDILTFAPTDPLTADTTYEVELPGGLIKDAAGNGMVEYSFTFSTGLAVGGNAAPDVASVSVADYPVAPGALVGVTINATDPEGDPLEYRFDFGDGTAKTAWSDLPSAFHGFAVSGHYRITGQVRDDAGAVASASTTTTVVPTLPASLPTHSSQVACDDDGTRVWTVNPDNNTVTALSAVDGAKLFEVPTCDDPRSLVVAAGEVWVSCFDSDEVAILDATTGAEIARLTLGYGSGPQGLVVSPDETTVFLALQSRGEILRLQRATRIETGRLPLGPTPRALAVSGDGSRLLVTRFRTGSHKAQVWDVDIAGFSLTDTIRIHKYGDEAHRDGTADGRGVANELTGITIDPSGLRAWVVAKKANVDGGALNGVDIDEDNSVRNLLIEIDLASNSIVRTTDLDNSESASAVAFSPLGDYAFVALQGNGEVVVLDALTDPAISAGSVVTRLGVGLAPQGLCVSLAGSLFVKNLTSRDVSVTDLTALLQFGDKSLETVEQSTVESEVMTAQVLLGKQIFYHASDERMSGEGYLSCAACHLDGSHDGRVWDFTSRGEGLRNTTTLRGRSGTAHGNVHWSANFDEIQDFENDIRGQFGGIGFLSDEDFALVSDPLGPAKAGLSMDLDALAAFVASLGSESLTRSPFRNADGTITQAAVNGEAVFVSLGCASCHAGSEYTDSTLGAETLHDVGTLRNSSGGRLGQSLLGIDTPSLLGLWNGAPYFHDGTAATLEEVFSSAGGTNIQVETGVASGANIQTGEGVFVNNDSSVRFGGYVQFSSAGDQVSIAGVRGGGGGSGVVEVRSSSGFGSPPLIIEVNGVQHNAVVPRPFNVPEWRHTLWDTFRIEGVALLPGSSNTVVLRTPAANNASIDEIVVSTVEDLAAAAPHRIVLDASPEDQADLLQFLLQLDGRGGGGQSGEIFSDGFETGSTSAWQ